MMEGTEQQHDLNAILYQPTTLSRADRRLEIVLTQTVDAPRYR